MSTAPLTPPAIDPAVSRLLGYVGRGRAGLCEIRLAVLGHRRAVVVRHHAARRIKGNVPELVPRGNSGTRCARSRLGQLALGVLAHGVGTGIGWLYSAAGREFVWSCRRPLVPRSAVTGRSPESARSPRPLGHRRPLLPGPRPLVDEQDPGAVHRYSVGDYVVIGNGQ